MATMLVRLLNLLFSLYSLAIVLRAFLPWFGVSHYHPVMRFLMTITEPLLAPLRRHIPPLGGLDFTPMAALMILWVVQLVLQAVVAAIF